MVKRHIVPAIGALRIRELDSEAVEAFYAALKAQGVGTRTPVKVHAVLHLALSDVPRTVLPSKPAALVRRKVPTYTAPRREPLTSDETATFLRAARGERLEALYILAATTGIRQGELFGLQCGDVDLERGKVTVTHALQDDASALGGLRVGDPKTNASRRSFTIYASVVDAFARR